jgi:uncharacterized protein YndB with AHSA1/START domain
MNTITIETTIQAPIEKVWQYWNEPEHIIKWAFASDDWEAPKAVNNLTVGGKFTTTMAAKDKSVSFDFSGTYTTIVPNQLIEYVMDKTPNENTGRNVSISFFQTGNRTIKIVETFDPENENPIEIQRAGWQAILENFKKHVESN